MHFLTQMDRMEGGREGGRWWGAGSSALLGERNVSNSAIQLNIRFQSHICELDALLFKLRCQTHTHRGDIQRPDALTEKNRFRSPHAHLHKHSCTERAHRDTLTHSLSDSLPGTRSHRSSPLYNNLFIKRENIQTSSKIHKGVGRGKAQSLLRSEIIPLAKEHTTERTNCWRNQYANRHQLNIQKPLQIPIISP